MSCTGPGAAWRDPRINPGAVRHNQRMTPKPRASSQVPTSASGDSASPEGQDQRQAAPVTILDRAELVTDGTYHLQTITADRARDLAVEAAAIRHVPGHPVAAAAAALLGIAITPGGHPRYWRPQPGDTAIIVDTSTQPPAIRLLTRTS